MPQLDLEPLSYPKLLLCTWCSFAVIMFLQSWSIAASVVPALLPALLCLASFALSTFVAERFLYRVLLSNLLIGIAFAVLHFNTPENFTSSLGGKVLTHGGHHTPFGHLVALMNYAVTVAGNLLGFLGFWYWTSLSAPAAASKNLRVDCL
jgi:hypothetical protein